MSSELTKEDYIVNYIKSLATLEEAMLPYREQRKDLRKSYVENGWLEKEELKLAIRTYRLMKQDVDFDELRETYRTIRYQSGKIKFAEDNTEEEE